MENDLKYVIKENTGDLDFNVLFEEAVRLFLEKDYYTGDLEIFVSNNLMYWLERKKNFSEAIFKIKNLSRVNSLLDILDIDFIIVPVNFKDESVNNIIVFSIDGYLYENRRNTLENLIKSMRYGL